MRTAFTDLVGVQRCRDHLAAGGRLRAAHRGAGRPAARGPGVGVSGADLDPRTPVVAGVGQAAERLDEPGYQCRSPVQLAADAARAALADTGADPAGVAAAIDTVAGVRQFETSVPGARAPLGRSGNFPRSVTGRIGADPARAVLEVSGGQAPQRGRPTGRPPSRPGR
jgi:hypothetical protein